MLVLINGGTISLGPLKDSAPAIIDAFYGGEMAAEALASVLFGETNPSGRMAATVYPPEYVNQIPLTQMAMKVPPGRTHLYYTGNPEFKFGDGLSYSTFESSLQSQSAQTVEASSASTVTFTVKVTHTAGPSGKHTILAMWRPINNSQIPVLRQKLFDYKSVFLQEGETQCIVFELKVLESLGVADVNGDRYVNPGAPDSRQLETDLPVSLA